MEQYVAEQQLTKEYTVQNTSNETQKIRQGYLIVKRAFDFISSLLLGIVLIIPCLIISVIIFITDPGSPLFIQERLGKDGKTIKIFKFRSMVKNAGDLKNMLTPEQYERYLKEFKLDDDPRLLPHKVGYYLRRLSLDELPQIIFNICIFGNMSVVGPRPVLQEELEMNYTPAEQKKFLSVKPGLTGYWQACGRNTVVYADGERQRMELYYADNCNAWFDIKIIFKSIVAVLKRDGAQ